MSLKDHPTIIVIPVVLAAAGFAWTVGYNTSDNRVKTLEAQIATSDMSNRLKLPQLLADISEASKQLGHGLEASRQVATLQKEIEDTKSREQQLQQRLTSIEQEKIQIESKLRQSEKIVQSIYADVMTFSLENYTTQDLLGYDLAVGVSSIGVGDVTVTFDNKKVTLVPGGEVTATKRGKTCTLRLKSVNYPKTAEFRFFVTQ